MRKAEVLKTCTLIRLSCLTNRHTIKVLLLFLNSMDMRVALALICIWTLLNCSSNMSPDMKVALALTCIWTPLNCSNSLAL